MVYIVLFFFLILNIILYNVNFILNGYIFIFSLFIWFYLMYSCRNNFVFMLRIFTLGIVGYLPVLVKIINSQAFFSFYMQETQTLDIVSIMLYFSNIAITMSFLGLKTGIYIKVCNSGFVEKENKMMFFIIFILIIIVGSILSLKNPLIFFGQYAKGGVSLPVHNLNTVGNILLFILVMYYYKFQYLYKKRINKKYIYFAIFYLLIFSELLRGARMDFLNGVIGLIALYTYYNSKNLKIKLNYIIYGILLGIVLQVIGLIRSVIGVYGFSKALENIQKYFSITDAATSSANLVLLNQGTINNIAATFSGVIYMIKYHILDFVYGQGYMEYLLRIPPQFLYPDRPQSYAWIFDKHGLSSGGGIFELAMAYLNFGVIGIFIVPFIVSFFISLSYKIFKINSFSLLYTIPFFSILAVFMRGEWYQTFTFFKGIITGWILVVFIYFLYALFNDFKIIKIRVSGL